jgi:predicted aldo/keto reductase-like oxidoreductase
MKRRKFIRTSLVAGSALSVYPYLNACNAVLPAGKQLIKRPLGKTGEKLSIIGFGGIVVRDTPHDEASNYVSEAIDHGLNYFDVAPSYGNAEEILGPALEPYRKDSFLACKTNKRDRPGAEEELHASLKKLKTDYFDLYQLHALSDINEVEQVFGPEGAMEVFIKAKKEGKVRFLGFSAHSQKAALLALEKFDFDTVLFPLNYVCWHQGNFGPGLVEKAKEKGMGILALKGMAHTRVAEGEDRP